MVSDALKELMEMRADPYSRARSWKERTGGKVLGFFCCPAPEEFIHAAGALPVRITGENREISKSAAHLQSYCCSLARTGLDMALNGSLSFLDGTVFVHTCDTMQRLSDIWRLNVGFAVHADVILPVRFESDSAWTYMNAELESFRQKLEELLGPIDDEKIAASIRTYNRNRELLSEIYDMRRANPAVLPYDQALWLVSSSALMEKGEHNELLEQIVLDLREGPAAPPAGAIPLFGIGSVMDQWDFLEMVSEEGATFIDDDFCNGHRYFDAMASEDLPPVEAVARRLWDRSGCPCKHSPSRNRASCLVDRAKESGASGAVFFQFKFCEPHAFDYPHVKKAFDEAGIPSLNLEIEQGSVSIGQMRTRVGALVETIKS
ncbi:MAG: 2-hydroxyacyl-CoA dehydratase subunit D [Candidatus Geothermincolia bacterium]